MTHRKNGKYKYPDMALKVIELDRQAVASVQGLMKKRLIFESLKYQNNQHYFALVGPRGVGKSVLLRQLRAETPESIYIDVGTLIKHNHLVSSMGLEKLIIALHEQHRLYSFFLDEVHLLPQFNQMLQNLADNYLLRIICAYPVDTKNSEKVIKRITTMPLSLREYIYFRKNTLLDPLPLEKLVEKRETREQRSLVLISFLHLYGGLYPPVEIDIDTTNKLGVVKNFVNIKESFFEERREYFENIIKKNIYTDIPAINQDVSMKDLALLEKSMTFIGTSPIDDVNVSTLSTALEITKYRAAKMLSLLEQCFLIHRCFPAGKNVSQEPKVLMMPPFRLLYRHQDECLELLKEDYFALAMAQHGVKYNYLKSGRGAKTSDFLLTIGGIPTVLKVGLDGTDRTTFKNIKYECRIILHNHRIPKRPFRSNIRGVPATHPDIYRRALHSIGLCP